GCGEDGDGAGAVAELEELAIELGIDAAIDPQGFTHEFAGMFGDIADLFGAEAGDQWHGREQGNGHNQVRFSGQSHASGTWEQQTALPGLPYLTQNTTPSRLVSLPTESTNDARSGGASSGKSAGTRTFT